MDRALGAGIIIMIFAAVLFAVGDVGIKVLGGNLSPWQIACGRGFLGVAVILTAVKFNFRSLMVRQWPVQLGLGLAGAMGFTCFVVSIKYLPLSIALPLSYVFPALGALMSPFINKEKPSRRDWLAIALALMAVICLSRGASPEAGTDSGAVGFVFGLAGAFFVAIMSNLARRQTLTVPLSINLFYLYFANFILGLPLVLLMDSPMIPPAADLGRLFLCIAPASVLGFCLMFIAYRSINAFRGATIMMLEAAMVGVFGVVMLNEPLTPFMVIGGLLMMSSAVTIALAGASGK